MGENYKVVLRLQSLTNGKLIGNLRKNKQTNRGENTIGLVLQTNKSQQQTEEKTA